MINTIDVGDIVLIETSKGKFLHGEVAQVFSSGVWAIRTSNVPDPTGAVSPNNGSLYYVQQYITMQLMHTDRTKDRPPARCN